MYQFPWTEKELSDINYIEVCEGIYNTVDQRFREGGYKKDAYIADRVWHVDDYRQVNPEEYKDLLVRWENMNLENDKKVIPYVIEPLYQEEPMFLTTDNIVLNTNFRTIFPNSAVHKERLFIKRYFEALAQENYQSISEEAKKLDTLWNGRIPMTHYPLS